nr:MAG TPA: hypothetical protein [Caudoviricetes sp.]
MVLNKVFHSFAFAHGELVVHTLYISRMIHLIH